MFELSKVLMERYLIHCDVCGKKSESHEDPDFTSHRYTGWSEVKDSGMVYHLCHDCSVRAAKNAISISQLEGRI